ncbi:MAG: 1,4-alpha-glucan branching enzyme [Solirubrobacteraceae bacterium]|nr:1,4-alpha-glucan branching enzyme [Solirubrobacteraceae bacterium]
MSAAAAGRAEIDLVVAGRHTDPHHVLGAHAAPDGVRIRAWRPGAEAVSAHVEGAAEPVALTRSHPAGVFEATIAGAALPLAYELDVDYPDGNRFRLHDPYAYPPTLGELDLHLVGEGRHRELYERLGAHPSEVAGVIGTAFAVWAPAAQSVSVVGDFNSWDGRLHPMRSMGSTGIWELFLPAVGDGARYKFEIHGPGGELRLKADPLAFEAEIPPGTSSVVHTSRHQWADADWMAARAGQEPLHRPMSIYEVHLGSWRRDPHHPDQALGYRELADDLAAYVGELGFTHVELMPVMAHPFSGSWGYQVTSYYAPTPQFGSPDDLREFVDRLHQAGIGVILDWVPAHFPRDDWALARFDGTALYEHEDPRIGAHPDWGTLVFNYGRNEVRNFLLANALYWVREYHVDGLRMDAVASMLYRDYSRKAGEWVPNRFGGREDLEAVEFLKEVNEVLYGAAPGIISAAEESTAWPGVSRPTYLGGLGFGFKWNMGWMHDTLAYFQEDPINRRYHHHQLTFSLMYAFSENFILPLSHDEVVHGKASLIEKMPGDEWQRLANLRALYAYMWAHPGKKLLFMGQEFAQEREWSHERSLDWHLLEDAGHAGLQTLVGDLNRVYRDVPALWAHDEDAGAFRWLEANDADHNVIAFSRAGARPGELLVCVCNLSPVARHRYRIGLPEPGVWIERLNTDSRHYGGGDVGNWGGRAAEDVPWHDQPHSAEFTLPPLAVLWLAPAQAAVA